MIVPARYQTISRRRRIIVICVCLLLGVLTTWIVTWVFATLKGPQGYVVPVHYRAQRHIESPVVTSWVGDWPSRFFMLGGASSRSVLITTSERVAESMRPRSVDEQAMLFPGAPTYPPLPEPQPMPDRVRRIRDELQQSPHRLRQYREYDFGWPFAAMRWRNLRYFFDDLGSGLTPEIQTGWVLEDPSWMGHHGQLVLPTTVLWPGFIANTTIAAAIWAVPLIVIGALRRRRAIAKGRCPMCRYDLRGDLELGCSECGWRR